MADYLIYGGAVPLTGETVTVRNITKSKTYTTTLSAFGYYSVLLPDGQYADEDVIEIEMPIPELVLDAKTVEAKVNAERYAYRDAIVVLSHANAQMKAVFETIKPPAYASLGITQKDQIPSDGVVENGEARLNEK